MNPAIADTVTMTAILSLQSTNNVTASQRVFRATAASIDLESTVTGAGTGAHTARWTIVRLA